VDAKSLDGSVMAFHHREYPVYAVQFHPEAVLTEYGHELVRAFIEICETWKCGQDAESELYIQKLEPGLSTADIYSHFSKEKDAVFLDSSQMGEQGRYSIIGRKPYLCVRQEQGILYVNEHAMEESFECWMGRYLKEHKRKNPTDLPISSGAIGYFTYDYGRKYEAIQSRHTDPVRMPEAYFCFYDQFVVEDLQKSEVYFVANGQLTDGASAYRSFLQELHCTDSVSGREVTLHHPDEAVSSYTVEEYKQAVEKTVDYICRGDIYIMNMTQQLRMKKGREPYDVFCRLRAHNPSPFGGYFQYGDYQIVCASPERFLRVVDGVVETRPIKGTRRRGTTPQEDEALKQELLESEKDRSELLMIVDLERNDLNRVCVPGSVQVTEHFKVETYATVFHLVSTVQGTLMSDKTAIDLIEAAFPGGSITGAPKIRAMEIIDELERDSRGLYTGIIGYFSLDGNCDFNIVIRTAVYQDGMYYLGAGGGITCESDPDFEYEETLQKAKAVMEAIGYEAG
jgi:para-aminobenzoate synthetase component 1